MKVLAFNGSPRTKGNTYFLLKSVCDILEKSGIETEIINIGARSIHGCIACGKCREKGNDQCIFSDDIVNECVDKIKEADGIILGSPVYFGNMTAQMKAFIDRVGYVCRPNQLLKRKVCSSVVSVRRNGALSTFNTMNNFFTIAEAVVVSSSYWNQGVGKEIGDVNEDEEGMNTMKTLGENMTWLLNKLK